VVRARPEAPEFVPAVRAPAQKLTREELAALSRPHVVRIESEAGMGIGFFIDHDLIVTCLHVVRGSDHVSVTTRDYVDYVGEASGVLSWSEEYDLAIVQVAPPRFMPGLALAGKSPSVDSHVVVVSSSPVGAENTVSDGLVSRYRTDPSTRLQFSPPILPGSSGGPILNDTGEVVGMVTPPLKDPYGGPTVEPVNSAVPAETINRALQSASRVDMWTFARRTESPADRIWRPIEASLMELAKKVEMDLGDQVGGIYARRIAKAVAQRNRNDFDHLRLQAEKATQERRHILALADALKGMPPDGPDLATVLIVAWEEDAIRETEATQQRLDQVAEQVEGYSRTYLEGGAIPVFPKAFGGLQFLSSVRDINSSCWKLNQQSERGVMLVECPHLPVSPAFVTGPVFLSFFDGRLGGVRTQSVDYARTVSTLSERYGLPDFRVWKKGKWELSDSTPALGANTMYEWRMTGGRIRAGHQYGKVFVSYVHEDFALATDDSY